jgi:hypothetical protein
MHQVIGMSSCLFHCAQETNRQNMLVGAGHSFDLFHASIQSILIDPAGETEEHCYLYGETAMLRLM